MSDPPDQDARDKQPREYVPTTGKYILIDRQPVACDDLLLWAHWLEEAGRTRELQIAFTLVGDGDDCHVSTIFLGIDYSHGTGPPLVFETMIFGGPKHGYQDRYSTYEEAIVGHEEACVLARRVLHSS